MNSRAYQLSSRSDAGQQGRRGERPLHAASPSERLTAEQLADALDFATGTREKYPGLPLGTRAIQLPDTERAVVPAGRVRPAGPADHLRVRADDAAEHRPGAAPAQRRLPEQEDRRPTGRIETLLKAKKPPSRSSRSCTWSTLSRPPRPDEIDQRRGLDRQGADAARGGAGSAVGAAELARVPVQSLIDPPFSVTRSASRVLMQASPQGAANAKRTMESAMRSDACNFCCLPCSQYPGVGADRDPTYWQDIRPIFRKHCTVCHSTQQRRASSTSPAAWPSTRSTRPRRAPSAPSSLPGKSDKSLLYELLVTADAKKRMPLDADPLPKETIALVKPWIDTGAKEGTKPAKSTTLPAKKAAHAQARRRSCRPPRFRRGHSVRPQGDRQARSRA